MIYDNKIIDAYHDLLTYRRTVTYILETSRRAIEVKVLGRKIKKIKD